MPGVGRGLQGRRPQKGSAFLGTWSPGLAGVGDLDHLVKVVFARCLHLNATIFPSLHTLICWEEGEGCLSPPPGWGHNLYCSGFFCNEGLSSSP